MDLLQTKGVEKQFLGVKALKGVDFSVKAGEIHALMGENGAGKSTLIKIITGVYPATAGSVYFNGKECKFRSPLDAEHAGISTVYQEVNLLPDLSVTNLCEEKDNYQAHGVFSTYQTMMNCIDSVHDEEGKLFSCGHQENQIFLRNLGV